MGYEWDASAIKNAFRKKKKKKEFFCNQIVYMYIKHMWVQFMNVIGVCICILYTIHWCMNVFR